MRSPWASLQGSSSLPQTHSCLSTSVPLLWERQEPLGKPSHPLPGPGLSGHQAAGGGWPPGPVGGAEGSLCGRGWLLVPQLQEL